MAEIALRIAVCIATGQSVTTDQVEYVRENHAAGVCKVVVVSDAFRLARWADALVAHDAQWWRKNRDALKFAGRKFAGWLVDGTEYLPPGRGFSRDSNSGLQGMRVAHEYLGATRLLLLGYDGHGTHYFGEHDGLPNTSERGFELHARQFARWKGCEVLNCSPGSELLAFPMADLDESLR